jgi:hypothetical protein
MQASMEELLLESKIWLVKSPLRPKYLSPILQLLNSCNS